MNNKTQVALLKWVNTFPLDARVESLTELSDGFALNQMLGDLDKQYFLDDLKKNTAPSKWLSKKQSLERVYKSLIRYIRNHCNGMDSITLENVIDFIAIAEHNDVEETVKLLTILLMAAISGVNREKYINRIQELEEAYAYEIMNIIKQMQVLEKQSGVPSTTAWEGAELPSTLTKDLDLAAEEELATLHAEYKSLKKRHADYITRHERLQDSHDLLLAEQVETKQELDALRASSNGGMADFVQNLKNDLQQREDLIASQEQQIESDRVIKERDKKELNSLKNASEQLLALEDQVRELKTANETLSRKANMADNYQRKLESQSGLEKENSKLRARIDTYESNQKYFDQTVEANAKLKASNDEYTRKFRDYENAQIEEEHRRNILQATIRERDIQIYSLTEQKRHDEAFIAELHEQISTAGPPSGYPQTPTAPLGGMRTLEQELEGHEHTSQALEISRLKAENQLLKSNTAGTTNANLRNDLLAAEEKYKRLQQQFNQLTEDHAINQEQLEAIISTSTGEKDEAVINTRRLYLEASKERDTLRQKVAEMNAKITSQDRELLRAKGDLEAVGEDELKSLENLKATHELITSSYQNDLLMLQEQHNILTVQNEEQKSHLVEALLAKDKLRHELANLRQGNSADSAEIRTDIGDSQEAARKTKSELEALKEKNDKLHSTLLELQRRLKAAEENSADAQKALIKNVLRENAMMSTAWYDLSSRLQSNHVVLQRRQDAPKSWLNKQRQMVNATPRR